MPDPTLDPGSAFDTSDEPALGGGLGTFERLLSLWVALAIVVGVAVGQLAPAVP